MDEIERLLNQVLEAYIYPEVEKQAKAGFEIANKEMRKQQRIIDNCISIYYSSYRPDWYERTGLLKTAYTKGNYNDFNIQQSTEGKKYKTGYSLSDLTEGVMAGYRPMGRGKPWSIWGTGQRVNLYGKDYNLGTSGVTPSRLLDIYRKDWDKYYTKVSMENINESIILKSVFKNI